MKKLIKIIYLVPVCLILCFLCLNSFGQTNFFLRSLSGVGPAKAIDFAQLGLPDITINSITRGMERGSGPGGSEDQHKVDIPVNTELDFYNIVRQNYLNTEELGDTLLYSKAKKMISVSFGADSHCMVCMTVDGLPVMSGHEGSDMVIKGEVNLKAGRSKYFVILKPQQISFPGGTLRDYFRKTAQTLNSEERELKPGFYSFSGNSAFSYEFGLSDVAFTLYDGDGRIRAIIPPEGVKRLWLDGIRSYQTLLDIPYVETFKYDDKGNLIKHTCSDAGKSEMKYSSDGRLLYSQNALQKLAGRYSYINYDTSGRPVEHGELSSPITGEFENITLSMLDANQHNSRSYPKGSSTEITILTYDTASPIPGMNGYIQNALFLKGGNIATKAKYNGVPSQANLESKIWYNYDDKGRVAWTVRYVSGLGYKTFDYFYDGQGNMVKSIYQKGLAAETMVHFFEYDKGHRLSLVYTNTADNRESKLLHAKYTYYTHGLLKRLELGDKLQGLDYIFSFEEKLMSINSADPKDDPGQDGTNGFAQDVFGMNLAYYSGAYNDRLIALPSKQRGINVSNYSSLIKKISWFSKKPNSADFAVASNTYSYDLFGQMTESHSNVANSQNSSTISTGEINSENRINYDGNGNIISLVRTNAKGDVIANYVYAYEKNSNKLKSVADYAQYSYDSLGQVASVIGKSNLYFDYNLSGRVTTVYGDIEKKNVILSFMYDEDGNRIMKKDHRINLTTWYSYDCVGKLLAIFEQQGKSAIQLKEQAIYGIERLGTFYRQGSSYQYSIPDHLGNIRVVINRNKTVSGAVDIVYCADYYPFGMELHTEGIGNRHGYQGLFTEIDKEIGEINLAFPNYDTTVGRRLTPDFKRQYYSPYVGMGNSPVNRFGEKGKLDGWNSYLYSEKDSSR